MDRFVTLADRLQARGMAVAMSFGPGEEGFLAQMQERAPRVIPIDGRAIGLSGLAQAMRQAGVVVAADTGPLHIATAVGARVVALFGPKDAALYGPRGEGHHVLYHDVPCRPCRLRTCPSPQCVLGIDVDRVEASVLELTDS
jgi:ADP-heptose:LPS heptosyltransferase